MSKVQGLRMEGTAILNEGVVHLAPESGPQDLLFEMHDNRLGDSGAAFGLLSWYASSV